MRFFDNGSNEGDGKFLLEMGGSQKLEGVGFIMEGCLWRPLYIAYPPSFFQILSNPLSLTFLQPPTSTLIVLSVVQFLWLNGWSYHIWCAILPNDNMDLHMSSLGTLVPEGPWSVFYATRCQVYLGLTHNVVFYWYSDLTSQTHTHSTLRDQ